MFFVLISRFPKNPERKNQWVRNMMREKPNGEKWTPSQSSLLCSDHFVEKYFQRTGTREGAREHLTRNAVPTKFKAFPKYLKKV